MATHEMKLENRLKWRIKNGYQWSRTEFLSEQCGNNKNVNSAEKFALEKTGNTKELSEAEEMELFKKEFYAELERIPRDRTIANVTVNISEEAFKR